MNKIYENASMNHVSAIEFGANEFYSPAPSTADRHRLLISEHLWEAIKTRPNVLFLQKSSGDTHYVFRCSYVGFEHMEFVTNTSASTDHTRMLFVSPYEETLMRLG